MATDKANTSSATNTNGTANVLLVKVLSWWLFCSFRKAYLFVNTTIRNGGLDNPRLLKSHYYVHLLLEQTVLY